MSGKTARKLRRLAKTMSGGNSTTVSSGDAFGYNTVYKPSSRGYEEDGPAIREVKEVDKKHPRAFYQKAKRALRDGTGAEEAKKIKAEYKRDQLAAAKKIADQIDSIVKAPSLSVKEAMAMEVGKLNSWGWLENFSKHIVDVEHPLVQFLPFKILTDYSEPEIGYLTVTGYNPDSNCGVMFVIGSVGAIRLYSGEIVTVNEDTHLDELASSILALSKSTNDYAIMEKKPFLLNKDNEK